MTRRRTSKTDLRLGRVPRLRRSRAAGEPVTPEELQQLQVDPEQDDPKRPLGLHDSEDDPLLD